MPVFYFYPKLNSPAHPSLVSSFLLSSRFHLPSENGLELRCGLWIRFCTFRPHRIMNCKINNHASAHSLLPTTIFSISSQRTGLEKILSAIKKNSALSSSSTSLQMHSIASPLVIRRLTLAFFDFRFSPCNFIFCTCYIFLLFWPDLLVPYESGLDSIESTKTIYYHCIRLSFLRPHITKRSEGKIQWANVKNFIFLFLSLTYTKEERCFYRVLEKFFYFCAKK